MKSANLAYRTSSRKPELHTETLFNKQIFFSLSLKKKKENKKQTNKKASKTKITKPGENPESVLCWPTASFCAWGLT